MKWTIISLLLCFFGFLREMRPSEPFVTDYLIYPWRNITSDQVNRYVYPIGTYSYAAQLVLIFLITDFLRYKPIIIASGISGIIVWSMLIWTKSLKNLQILEIFYGTYMATEIGYFTYIYAKVDKEHYLKVTSYARAAVLSGRFIAGTIGQIFVYTKLMDYRQLHILTLSAQIGATIWAFLLPSVDTSLYFHKSTQHQELPTTDDDIDSITFSQSSSIENNSATAAGKYKKAFRLFGSHFKSAYTNYNVLIWSVWYSVAMCGYLQIISYIQVLWTNIEKSHEIIWNGAVEACITLLAAMVSISAGYIHIEKIGEKWKLFALLLLSIIQGLAIILAATTINIYLSYLGYMVFCILYSFTITVASAEIAQHIEEDCFGLVFGLNTLIALILQTLLTLIVVTENSLFVLDVFQQYFVYGCYFFAMAFIYFIAILYKAMAIQKKIDVT